MFAVTNPLSSDLDRQIFVNMRLGNFQISKCVFSLLQYFCAYHFHADFKINRSFYEIVTYYFMEFRIIFRWFLFARILFENRKVIVTTTMVLALFKEWIY